MSNSTQKSAIDSIWVAAIKTLKLQTESARGMRGETMKDKSKKSTYSTTFGIDPNNLHNICAQSSILRLFQ